MRRLPNAADREAAEQFVRALDADRDWIARHWSNLVAQAAIAEMHKREHLATVGNERRAA